MIFTYENGDSSITIELKHVQAVNRYKNIVDIFLFQHNGPFTLTYETEDAAKKAMIILNNQLNQTI